MADYTAEAKKKLRGRIPVPGDKSISHRFVMLSSLAEGTSRAKNILRGEDCVSTMNAFRAMGVRITDTDKECSVSGVGLYGLTEPRDALYLGNSGTTMRLLTGILAGQRFTTVLTGDDSLSRRPMDRVVVPLRQMGAKVTGTGERLTPPLRIEGQPLTGVCHHERIGSAQVKSALLLAGLYAQGQTTVIEEKPSRDHTERMLAAYGAAFTKDGSRLTLDPSAWLTPLDNVFVVPGDISSAAFFIVAALIVPGSEIVLKDVCLNPTRTGLLDVLGRMGADITITEKQSQGEPFGDLLVKTSRLRGTTVPREAQPFLIDELPVLMIACALAEGESVIEQAAELRVKETDRIASMSEGLQAIGAVVAVDGDTVRITGVERLRGGASVMSYGDHRTAMSFIVAGLAAQEPITVRDVQCVQTSYPQFFDHLHMIRGR